MKSPLSTLFILLIAILLVRQVRAPFPHLDEDPDPEPIPIPKGNDNEIPGSQPNDNLPGGDHNGVPAPAPVQPAGQGNEEEFKEEDTDYSDILDAVSNLLDALTSVISDLNDGSSTTTVSAPLPTAALPCYRVSSIYDDCARYDSVFLNVIFPVQASCLCYHRKSGVSSPIWVPTAYDGLISSCNAFAQTQTLVESVSMIGNQSSEFNLCASAGDVRATPALALASSTSSAAATTTTSSAQPANGPTTQSSPTPTGTSGASRVSVVWSLVAGVGLGILSIVV